MRRNTTEVITRARHVCAREVTCGYLWLSIRKHDRNMKSGGYVDVNGSCYEYANVLGQIAAVVVKGCIVWTEHVLTHVDRLSAWRTQSLLSFCLLVVGIFHSFTT